MSFIDPLLIHIVILSLAEEWGRKNEKNGDKKNEEWGTRMGTVTIFKKNGRMGTVTIFKEWEE